MVESLTTRILLRLGAAATLAFLYAPLVVIGLYAFNAQVTQGWPIQDWSTKWFRVAYEDEAVRQALWLSVQAALLATLVAMVLGTLLSSADLGADSWQTFRYVTFPELRTPLLAGALLAFALSFDEVIVTLFTSGAQQTLPIWIFANLQRPRELPVVNVVALFVLVASIVPVYLAQKLSRGVATGVPVGEK